MKITVKDYVPLEIPQKYLTPLTKDFGEDTPYVSKIASRILKRSYRQGKLPLKLLCLLHLKAEMEKRGGYQSYNEPLAGVGLSARLLTTSDTALYLNDFDSSCRDILKLNFPEAAVTGVDAFNSKFVPSDLIFMDFNNFTLKRSQKEYASVLDNVFDAAQRFVIINDCSLFYLRYGEEAFRNYSKLLGEDIKTVPEYLANIPDSYGRLSSFRVVTSAYFAEAAWVLLEKDPSDVARSSRNSTSLRQIMTKDIPPGFVTVS